MPKMLDFSRRQLTSNTNTIHKASHISSNSFTPKLISHKSSQVTEFRSSIDKCFTHQHTFQSLRAMDSDLTLWVSTVQAVMRQSSLELTMNHRQRLTWWPDWSAYFSGPASAYHTWRMLARTLTTIAHIAEHILEPTVDRKAACYDEILFLLYLWKSYDVVK